MRSILASFLISCVLLVSTVERTRGIQVNVLDQDDVVLVDSVGSNRITFHRNTSSVDHLRPLIVDRIKLAVDSISRVLEVIDVEFRVLIFPERTIPAKGMSGAAPNEDHIYILLDPDHPRLAKSLSEELVPTIAHEYHHTLRKRTVGYVSNLFEAFVSEGLADHFAEEITGETPPWSDPPPEEVVVAWRAEAERVWLEPQFDYAAWFVGLNSDIPRGTGYAIGRRIVEEYLASHPNQRASTLFDVSAREFFPPKEGWE